jgi:alpha-1,2-mannosyltransferase
MARLILPGITAWEGFPLWHSQTWRAFWLLLLPGQIQLSEILALVLSLLGVAAFLIFRRRIRQKEILFCAAIFLTLWIAPHAMIYDWAILLLPALILWQTTPGLRSLWRAAFALLWTASFVAGPLVILQKVILPVAVQVSLPALGLAIAWVWQPVKNAAGLDSSAARSPQSDNQREQ